VNNHTDNPVAEDQKTYEIGYILSPLVSEEKLAEVFNKTVKAAVEAAGSSITAQQSPKMVALAYPISKMINNKRSIFKDAYFGAVRFDAAPDVVHAAKELLDKAPEVIRHLLIVVPASAQPLAAQKGPNARSARPEDRVEETPESEVAEPVEEPAAAEGEKAEMTKEDIDKEIEGLLTPTV